MDYQFDLQIPEDVKFFENNNLNMDEKTVESFEKFKEDPNCNYERFQAYLIKFFKFDY